MAKGVSTLLLPAVFPSVTLSGIGLVADNLTIVCDLLLQHLQLLELEETKEITGCVSSITLIFPI